MKTLERSALVACSIEHAFNIVNDVGRYPEFLPGCIFSEVLESSAVAMLARVQIKARGLSETFTTRNVIEAPNRIELNLLEGPFEILQGAWRFTPLSAQGCKVELELRYKLKGLARTISPLIGSAADRVVDAFVDRFNALSPDG